MNRTPVILFSALLLVAPMAWERAAADAPAATAPAGNCGAAHRDHKQLNQERRQRHADTRKLDKDKAADDKSAAKTDRQDVKQDDQKVKSDKQALHQARRGHPCQDVPKAATGANPAA